MVFRMFETIVKMFKFKKVFTRVLNDTFHDTTA